MTELSKLFIKNIPDGFPDDKLIELLKKQFENMIVKIRIYKHDHKYKNKLNKISFIIIKNNPEVKDKIFEFFSSFELVDQRGIKHKLKVVESLVPYEQTSVNVTDKVNNTISNTTYFKKFVEFLNNNKVIDFKQEENKYEEGIFEGIEEKKPEPEIVDRAPEKKVITRGQAGGKKIIVNKANTERNLERAEPKESIVINRKEKEVEVAAENQNNYNESMYNDNYGGKGNSYKNNNYYNNKGNNYNNNYSGNNYNNNKRYYNQGNNYNNNNYDNYNYGKGNSYNNNYDNSYNNNYNNDGYFENDNYYNKKKYYKK